MRERREDQAAEIRRRHPDRPVGPHWEGFAYLGDGVWGDPEVYDWVFDESSLFGDLPRRPHQASRRIKEGE